VPYYRILFDAHGIDVNDIRGVDDLRRIPITSKQDLQRQELRHLLASGFDPAHAFAISTGGSSGHPLTVWRSRYEENLLKALSTGSAAWDYRAFPRLARTSIRKRYSNSFVPAMPTS
jgi:phenylacetate-coenzyme A ligase PaaK-like adenylate-forming protein